MKIRNKDMEVMVVQQWWNGGVENLLIEVRPLSKKGG